MRRFDAINGLLVPGGSGNLTKGNPFYDNTEYLLKLAIEANDNGDYFPVRSWSHCSWSYSPDVCVLPCNISPVVWGWMSCITFVGLTHVLSRLAVRVLTQIVSLKLPH